MYHYNIMYTFVSVGLPNAMASRELANFTVICTANFNKTYL